MKKCITQQYSCGALLKKRYQVVSLLCDTEHSTNIVAVDLLECCDVLVKECKDEEENIRWRHAMNVLRKGESSNGCLLHVMDNFVWEGVTHIVTEFLGVSLYDLLGQRTIQPDDLFDAVFGCFRQTLQYIHGHGLIHCDIKPSNILANPYSAGPLQFKLIDYGNSTVPEGTVAGQYVQSRYYRAPEIIMGCPWGYPVDVWAAGCVLVECLSGEVLFPADNDVEHILMIYETLGCLPQSLCDVSTKNSDLLEAGTNELNEQLRAQLRPCPLGAIVRQQEYVELLELMLCVDPSARMTAEGIAAVVIQ